MHNDHEHRLVEMIAETSGRSYQNTFVPRTGPSTSYVSINRWQWKRCGRDIHVADSRTPSNGRGGSDLARLETAVPVDQRPATQLKELREAQLYSWVRIKRSGIANQEHGRREQKRHVVMIDFETKSCTGKSTHLRISPGAGSAGNAGLLETLRCPIPGLLCTFGGSNRISDFRSSEAGEAFISSYA